MDKTSILSLTILIVVVVILVIYTVYIQSTFYTKTASDLRYMNVVGDAFTGNLALGGNDITGVETIVTENITATNMTPDGVIHNNVNGVFSTSKIVDADIDDAAAITDDKLDVIETALKVSNSATTADSANTAFAIVARDVNGDFAAGEITVGSIIAPDIAPDGVIHNNVNGLFSSSKIIDADIDDDAGIVDTKLGVIETALKVSNSATTADSDNVGSAIVARDINGDFAMGVITLTGILGQAIASEASPEVGMFPGTLWRKDPGGEIRVQP